VVNEFFLTAFLITIAGNSRKKDWDDLTKKSTNYLMTLNTAIVVMLIMVLNFYSNP